MLQNCTDGMGRKHQCDIPVRLQAHDSFLYWMTGLVIVQLISLRPLSLQQCTVLYHKVRGSVVLLLALDLTNVQKILQQRRLVPFLRVTQEYRRLYYQSDVTLCSVVRGSLFLGPVTCPCYGSLQFDSHTEHLVSSGWSHCIVQREKKF
jgi:hypothetical protein